MLNLHLNNYPGIITSGICNDGNQLDKIFQLLKIDIVIIISSNNSFIEDVAEWLVGKRVLLICPEKIGEKFMSKNNYEPGAAFQMLHLNSNLSGLKEKLEVLSEPAVYSQQSLPSAYISKREKEILQLILRGKKSKEIADELYLSLRTIENHRNNILKKTKSKSMISLINDLYRMGFLS